MPAASGKRRVQFRPLISLAGLDLNVLPDQGTTERREMPVHRCLLSFKAEARSPLPFRADAVVGYELDGFLRHDMPLCHR
jgi:hypothetical protein